MIDRKRRNTRAGFITVLGLGVAVIFGIISLFSNSPKKDTVYNTIPTISGNNNTQIIGNGNFVCHECVYDNTNDPNYLNPRSEYLQGKSPQELSKLFLELQNQNSFKDACSILPKKKGDTGCNSIDPEQVNIFSIRTKKLQFGYENTKIINSEIASQYKEIICVRYEYKLKTDTDPRTTAEIMAFYFDKREDGERELTSRVCEYKQKGDEKRDCPKPTANKICIGKF